MRLAETDRQLTGSVEIDAACPGPGRSGGRSGQGSENTVPFVAAVQTTEDGQPHLAAQADAITRNSTDRALRQGFLQNTSPHHAIVAAWATAAASPISR